MEFICCVGEKNREFIQNRHSDLNVGQVKFNNTHDMQFLKYAWNFIQKKIIFNENFHKLQAFIHQMTQTTWTYDALFINKRQYLFVTHKVSYFVWSMKTKHE